MVFQRKKQSPIERRLEELQKEMACVNRDLKNVARAGSVATEMSGARPPMFPENPPPAPEAVPDMAVPGVPGVDPNHGDLFAHATKRAVTSDKPAELFPDLAAKGVGSARAASASPAPPPESRSGREKFAHYFMAGHFQNLRPSRQEGRVVRNKAIMMLIAAASLLAWLLYYLRSH